MARVPVIEIPNAARTGGTALAPTSTPAYDFSASTRNLMQEQMSLNAFSSEAAGYADIGQAVGSISGALDRYTATIQDGQARMQRARDVGNLAEIDKLRSERLAEYMATLNPNEPQKWAEGWKKIDEKINNDIKNYPLSEWGREQLALESTKFIKDTNIQIGVGAIRQTAKNSQDAVAAKSDRLLQEGDYEGSAAALGQLRDIGGVNEGGYQQGLTRIKEQQQNDMIAGEISADPWALKSEMQAILKGEESHWDIPKSKALTVFNNARVAANTQESELIEQALNGVASGRFQSEEDLKAFNQSTGGRIGEANLAKMGTALVREIPYNAEHVTKARSLVFAYSGQNDNDMRQFYEAADFIGSKVPKNLQGELMSVLKSNFTATTGSAKGKNPDQVWWGDFSSRQQRLADMGIYGDMGKDADGKKIVDVAKNNEYWRRYDNWWNEFHKWAKDNPAASPDERDQKWSSIVGKAVQDTAQRTYQNRMLYSGGVPLALTPSIMIQPRLQSSNLSDDIEAARKRQKPVE